MKLIDEMRDLLRTLGPNAVEPTENAATRPPDGAQVHSAEHLRHGRGVLVVTSVAFGALSAGSIKARSRPATHGRPARSWGP